MRLLCALALFGPAYAPASAQQSGSIVGTVVTRGSGRPVDAAAVALEGTERSATTDNQGRFALNGLPAGRYVLVSSRLGYAHQRLDVTLRPGATERLEIELVESAVDLPTLVVTANREAQDLARTAASVGVIARGALQDTKPAHPSEIMGQVPGVWVNVTGGEGHMTAIRQPLGTEPVYLYLEDGVPTRSTGFFNHNALYEVNVPQADRIEVFKGPGTALYGSDAIGGVVNVETRAPSPTTATELSLEAGANGFARALGSLSGSLGGEALRADLNYTRTDGWRAGTAYDRISGTLRWDHFFAGGASLKAVATYSSIDQKTAGSSALSRADFENQPTINYTPISFRDVGAVRVHAQLDLPVAGGRLSLTPFGRSNRMDLLPNWSLTFDPAIWETENTSLGLLARFSRSIETGDGLLVAGVDLDRSPGSHAERSIVPVREGSIFTSYTDGTPLYQYDVTFMQASPYVHAEISPAPRIRLSAGLRGDFLGYDYVNHLDVATTGRHRRPPDASPSYSAWSPKVGATFAISPRHSAFVSYREGFRAPSEGQVFRQGQAENTLDLEPVRTRSTEVGLRGSFAGRFSYDLAAYRMVKRNDIVSFTNPDGSTETQNAGRTLHRGLEAGLGLQLLDGLAVHVAYSLAEHTYEEWSPRPGLDYGGNEQESAPNRFGTVRVDWTPPALPSLRFGAEMVDIGAYWEDATNENEYEGHQLLNLRAAWELSPRLGLFGRLQNVTDERYAERASYNAFRGEELAPGLPRQLFMGVQVR